MVQTNVSDSDGESSGEQTDDAQSEHGSEQESVDPETREEVLAADGYRCQACGRRGPQAGGLATLQVHHIERAPADMDEHALENLTTLCRSCHSWLHQRSSSEDSPVELTDEDMTELLPQDVELLRILSESGPARTGDIAAELTADLSVNSTRQRLWVLMGLDNLVGSRDQQLVDKDRETGEWGLTNQIEVSERGHIPDDPQLLIQRMEDEQVREALDRGCDRETVAEVFGMSRRTTFNKEKRAAAFEFPLEAIYRKGGRGTAESDTDGDGEQSESAGDERGASGETGEVEVWGRPDESAGDPDVDAVLGDGVIKHEDVVEQRDGSAMEERVEEAIVALEAFREDLSVG